MQILLIDLKVIYTQHLFKKPMLGSYKLRRKGVTPQKLNNDEIIYGIIMCNNLFKQNFCLSFQRMLILKLL